MDQNYLILHFIFNQQKHNQPIPAFFTKHIFQSVVYTPKFNIEPENDDFQKESPFPGADFQVPC